MSGELPIILCPPPMGFFVLTPIIIALYLLGVGLILCRKACWLCKAATVMDVSLTILSFTDGRLLNAGGLVWLGCAASITLAIFYDAHSRQVMLSLSVSAVILLLGHYLLPAFFIAAIGS